MPCIMVGESCPCWTEEVLASIDGTLSDGTEGYLGCRLRGGYIAGKMESDISTGGEDERLTTKWG